MKGEIMQCAICKNELKEGFLKNPRGVIAWTPKGEKANVLQSRVKDNQVRLGQSRGLGVNIVECNYCEECEMFFIKK